MEREEYVRCPSCNDETFKVRKGEVCFDASPPLLLPETKVDAPE